MKNILVVDWLDKYGGAERVVSSIASVLSFDKCYMLINVMKQRDITKVFAGKDIQISETNLKYFGKNFRFFFFLFPYFLKQIKVEKDTNLIISSSFSIAKGARKTNKTQLHICYYQARNQRYLWDNEGIYFSNLIRMALSPVLFILRRIDISQSKTPDYIIANSRYIQKWIKRNYKRDSFLIHPPVDTRKFPVIKKKENYYVTAARLEPYKRIDLLVSAFNKLNEELIIIGSGSQKQKLMDKASPNIKFIDYSSSEIVHSVVGRAKAFLHAGLEDFGIALVEAQACGTPVIAYGKGGVLETVVDGSTGILFFKQTPEAILEAIKRFNQTKFDCNKLRENAERFSRHVFEQKFKSHILNKTEEWQEKNKEDSQDILGH